MSKPTYEMTIDLNVLDHLGINLYSNVAAVLTEIVANAWDADAESIAIEYDSDNDRIEIADDGIGMTVSDMNQKFLRVGHRRRATEPTITPKGRPVMGRKGLGKLSLFSIADHIQVESAKDGEFHGLRMDVERIRDAIDGRASNYVPDEMPRSEVTITGGTRITLSSLKRNRVPATFSALRRRIARRFSVIGSADFRVFIEGAEVTTSDRDDLRVVQYLWHIGSIDEKRKSGAVEATRHAVLEDRLMGWDSSWQVSGWIGTATKPKRLETEGGNLNSIVLMARGRLIQENLLESINDGRLYTKYLTGQLEADFLDLDTEADIATSDRQRVQEGDPRTEAIKVFLRSALNKVETQWTKWRNEDGADEVAEEHPVVKEWFDSLDGAYKEHARALIAKIGGLPVDEEDDRKQLLRDGILAFERLKLRGSTADLAAAVDLGAERLMPLIAQRDSLEAALYRDIIQSRLQVIKVFQRLTDDNEKEKALQEFLFDHMWLIDPTWERADGTELIETRLMEAGVIVDDLTEKEKLGRVDIKYRTVLQKHVIVELKRADRRMGIYELADQGSKYVDKLTKILAAQNEFSPNIEVVFVVGPTMNDELANPDRVKATMNGVSPGSRIVHFDTLIQGALRAYQQFIDSSRKLDRIDNIVNRL